MPKSMKGRIIWMSPWKTTDEGMSVTIRIQSANNSKIQGRFVLTGDLALYAHMLGAKEGDLVHVTRTIFEVLEVGP